MTTTLTIAAIEITATMKLKHQILIILVTLISSTNADTITVKQDGTGDYTVIQNAINASINGDTVLVYPGTYYENIDFAGHSITLASLVLTTGDINYKYSTIIDGDSSGSCVRSSSNEVSSIIGFTLQHGTGSLFIIENRFYGGGIYIEDASLDIINCIVKNNFASTIGGGIICHFGGNCFLSGTSIFNNHTYGAGGGLVYGFEGYVELDSVNRCSIYSNYSSRGCDLWKRNENPFSVYLDTCTVLNPDIYFFLSSDNVQNPIDDLELDILNTILTPVDADLYVNTQTGDDNNSGLSPDEPLKTISHANSLIYPDSINKNTIYLADGVYSDSANNEKFPLNIRGYVDIRGQSMENTILDGRYRSTLVKGNVGVSNFSHSRFKLLRGGKVYPNTVFHDRAGLGILYSVGNNISIDSVIFQAGHSYYSDQNFYYGSTGKGIVSNCLFTNNFGGASFGMDAEVGDSVIISNCKFIDNMPDYEQDILNGGGIVIFGYNTPTVVTGCLFAGNNNYPVTTIGGYEANTHNYFVNCTFTGNTAFTNDVSLGFTDASTSMYNCILFDETNEIPISVIWAEVIDTLKLNIYNSLIENGAESIYLRPGLTSLHYDETNIEGDPLFYYGPDFPYNLSDNSPCIDAGTLDLPTWIELPELDLAGNPRIYGETIDMGAYEWNPTVGIDENKSDQQGEGVLQVAPNPFSGSITITAINKAKAEARIEIYNNNGQRVKQLLNGHFLPQTAKMIWNGVDYNGVVCPPGVYYVTMVVNNRIVEEIKIVKL